MLLSCHSSKRTLEGLLDSFEEEDFEDVRRLYSFRSYVESKGAKERLKLLQDNEFLEQVLIEEIAHFHKYLNMFHLMLRCLHVLVRDLPRAPLGKQVSFVKDYLGALVGKTVFTTYPQIGLAIGEIYGWV